VTSKPDCHRATDDALPRTGSAGGLLSAGERGALIGLGVAVSGTAEDRLFRELNSIYSSLTLPTDKLIVSYPQTGVGGGDKRPSFVFKRLKTIFSLTEKTDADFDYRQDALQPCFELAASAKNQPDSVTAAAAFEYLSASEELSEKLKSIAKAADLSRGRLTGGTALRLYGDDLTMSASRVDKFYSCRFLYFLQYGLNRKYEARRLRRADGRHLHALHSRERHAGHQGKRRFSRGERGALPRADGSICRHLCQ
jgi:ATP-dependent helicase/nuclease subunit B